MATVDVIIQRFVSQGASGLKKDFNDLAGGAATAETRFDRLSDKMIGFGATTAGAMALAGGASLKAYGRIQMAEIGFSKTLGSMDKAKGMLNSLKEFDRTSPFSFSESIKGAQRLSAVGFKAEELLSVLRDIGDATSGTGGDTSAFMGIAKAIGQMQAKGKLSMEEVVGQLAEHGIPALQILQKQLKLTDEQLTDFMEGEYTIKSDLGVPALLKGFRELYGGSMAEAAKTFPGQVSNLQSAVEQLGAAVGEVLAKGGETGSAIAGMTDLADETTEFIKNNPELVKTGLAIAGITAATTLGVGVLVKFFGIWREGIGLLKGASKAKDLLTKSTLADAAAEKLKTGIAGAEGAAIAGVGKKAGLSATAAMRLAAADAEAAMAAEDAAAAAGKQAAKLSLLQRAKNLWNKPLGTGAMSTVPYLQKGAFRDPVTGQFVSNKAWNANKMAAARSGLYTRPASLLSGQTVGSMAMRGAVGAAAGFGVQDDMKALGYGAGESLAAGATVGLAAAFVPGAQIPAAIAAAFRYGAEEAYIKPLEQEARQGSGLSNKEIAGLAGKSKRELADEYFRKAEEKRTAANQIDTTFDFAGDDARRKRELEMDAEALQRQGNNYLTQDRRNRTPGSAEFQANQFAGLEAWSKTQEDPQRMARRIAAEQEERKQNIIEPALQDQTNHTNGSTTVTFRIPEREADKSYRRLRYSNLTPSPSY